jgi:hypothetical protein
MAERIKTVAVEAAADAAGEQTGRIKVTYQILNDANAVVRTDTVSREFERDDFRDDEGNLLTAAQRRAKVVAWLRSYYASVLACRRAGAADLAWLQANVVNTFYPA